MNFADIPDNLMTERKDGELSQREKKIAERLVLELYCQYETSLPFREIIGPEVSLLVFYLTKTCAILLQFDFFYNFLFYLERRIS